MRIFASVGTGLEPFDRLIAALDDAIEQTGHCVGGVCQTGSCARRSRYLENQVRVTRIEFARLVAEADLVVCHAGVGAIRTAVGAGHAPCVMPRLVAHREVVNDHQLEVVRELAPRGLVRRFDDAAGLATLLVQGPRRLPTAKSGLSLPAEIVTALRATPTRAAVGRSGRVLLGALAALGPRLCVLRVR